MPLKNKNAIQEVWGALKRERAFKRLKCRIWVRLNQAPEGCQSALYRILRRFLNRSTANKQKSSQKPLRGFWKDCQGGGPRPHRYLCYFSNRDRQLYVIFLTEFIGISFTSQENNFSSFLKSSQTEGFSLKSIDSLSVQQLAAMLILQFSKNLSQS